MSRVAFARHGGYRVHPARGTDARADRHQRGRDAHQDPRQVPARDRERGVGPAPRARLRQELPADLRRLPGARQRGCWSTSSSAATSARPTTSCARSSPLARERERAGGAARGSRRGRRSRSCVVAVVVVLRASARRAQPGTSRQPPARTRPARTHARATIAAPRHGAAPSPSPRPYAPAGARPGPSTFAS